MKARLEFDAPESCAECTMRRFSYDGWYCVAANGKNIGMDKSCSRASFCPLKIVDEQTIGERMTEEERDVIRARCDVLLAEYDKSKVAWLLNDTYALLDALDAAEDEKEDAQAKFTVEYVKRQRAEARAEELERAIHAFEYSTGIFSFACFCCIYKNKNDIYKCELLKDEVCENLENWQFDEARFSEGGVGDE